MPLPPLQPLIDQRADLVRQAMRDRGVSIVQVARVSGINRVTLQKFLSKKTGLFPATLDKLCKILDL